MAQVPSPVRAVPAGVNVAVNGLDWDILIRLLAKYAPVRVMDTLRAQGINGILQDPVTVYAVLYESVISAGFMTLFAGGAVRSPANYLAPLMQEIAINKYPPNHPYNIIDPCGLSLCDAARVFADYENLSDVLIRNAQNAQSAQ